MKYLAQGLLGSKEKAKEDAMRRFARALAAVARAGRVRVRQIQGASQSQERCAGRGKPRPYGHEVSAVP